MCQPLLNNCDPLSLMICRGNPRHVNPCRLFCLCQHLLYNCDPLLHMICCGNPRRVNPCRLLCMCQHLLHDLTLSQEVVGGREGDGMDAQAGVGSHDT